MKDTPSVNYSYRCKSWVIYLPPEHVPGIKVRKHILSQWIVYSNSALEESVILGSTWHNFGLCVRKGIYAINDFVQLYCTYRFPDSKKWLKRMEIISARRSCAISKANLRNKFSNCTMFDINEKWSKFSGIKIRVQEFLPFSNYFMRF